MGMMSSGLFTISARTNPRPSLHHLRAHFTVLLLAGVYHAYPL